MTTPYVSSGTTPISLIHINAIDSLLGQNRWSSSTIGYSFPFSNSTVFWSTLPDIGYGPPFGDGEPWSSAAAPLTSTDEFNFELALQQWANVANLQFVKISEITNEVGDIRIAYSEDPDSSVLAWSYLPSDAVQAGDIWINSSSILNTEDWNPGSISFETILHEIGHTLGLKHPFADPKHPDTPTLPAEQDNTIHTIMSYTYANLQGQTGNEFSYHPTTPMVFDIAAIQYLYGANLRYHAGNDAYEFNDASLYHQTIWDAGGVDTLRYAGSFPCTIDLNPTAGSFIGQAVFVQDNGVNFGSPVPNVWIANNCVIENAVAGQANDRLIGNSSDNLLDGSAGIDTVRVVGSQNDFVLKRTSTNSFTLDELGSAGNQDTLLNIERLEFDDGHRALDLDNHAGQVAKLLGAVFGTAFISNPSYVGIGLNQADSDLDYAQLGQFALDAAGLNTHEAIVNQLWQNLYGSTPSNAEKSPYVRMLDTAEISSGGLAVLAADSGLNADHINLLGLAQNGIAYV